MNWTLPATRDSKQTALRQKILGWIEDGTLCDDDRLPSIRRLAEILGVAKGTVADVYQELAAEGHLTAKTGSGYIVRQLHSKTAEPIAVKAAGVTPPLNRNASIAARAATLYHPHSVKPLACRCPVMDLFPEKEWKAISARLSRSPWRHTGYSDPQGFLPLREAICRNLEKYRGFSVGADQIVVTTGTVNALYLLSQTLFEPGQTIAMESPANPLFADIFRYAGLNICWLPQDTEGAVLPTHPVNGILLTPSFSVPLGRRMSPARRREWLQYAVQHSLWLIENDFDAEFAFTADNIPAIHALSASGQNVIYVGTFSSIMFPGLKTGYIVAPTAVTPALTGLRQMADRFTDESRQAALAEFITTGEYERHLRKVSRLFDERRTVILEELNSRITPYGCIISDSYGSHVTAAIHPTLNDQTIVRYLKQAGVEAHACSTFAGNFPCNGLMLGFGTFAENEIRQAVGILFEVLGNL